MSEDCQKGLESRCEDRFAMKAGASLPVKVTRAGSEADETGKAVDISLSGAKIELGSAVAPKSQLEIAINGREEGQKAEVCWSRPAPGGAWWVGCRFDQKLPFELIDGLAEEGIIDRRQDQRRLMSVEGYARFELEAEERPVRLVDMSRGGFSLIAASDPGDSQRLMFSINAQRGTQPVMVTARVAWSKPVADGYQIGCQFATRHGFQQLHESLLLPSKSILTRWKPVRNRSQTAILVAVLVIAMSVWLIASR